MKNLVKGTFKNIFSVSPAFVRPILKRIYEDASILPGALYLRLVCRRVPKQTEPNLDSIMHSLDYWAFKHSGIFTHSTNGYQPVHSGPGMEHRIDAISQVREEISEFVRVMLLKGLNNSILEVGLGGYGGTHILWRHIFSKVITIELYPYFARKFKLSEWLDSRSVIITGSAEDPGTLEKVRACVDSVDVLFIDGSHKYEYVSKDWAIYHSMVRQGGIVAFHDSAVKTTPGIEVAKFLEDLSGGLIDNRRYSLHQIAGPFPVGISYYEQSQR